MTILLYPVRPGDHNPELQYSARSVARNLLMDDLQIVTVGYCPRWFKPDDHIVGNLKSTSPENVWDNIKIASEKLVSMDVGKVIVFNDDFFVLDPITEVVPVYRGKLVDHLGLLGPNQANWWARSMRNTLAYMQHLGFEDPLSYDLHRPLPISTNHMAEYLNDAEENWIKDSSVPPQWRTVYGNRIGLKAHQVDDCRLRRNGTVVGSPFLSTSDDSWRLHQRTITRFLTVPSRWEK